MADDRRQPCQSTSRRGWRTWRKSGDGLHERGLNAKIHLAMDAHGMPVRFFITPGTTADCTVAARLIEGFQAKYLLADRGYDTDAILLKAVDEGMIPVIPPRKNRKHLREYDESLYKAPPSRGECVPASQKVARYCDPLRQKCCFFRCHCPNPLHWYLAPY